MQAMSSSEYVSEMVNSRQQFSVRFSVLLRPTTATMVTVTATMMANVTATVVSKATIMRSMLIDIA